MIPIGVSFPPAACARSDRHGGLLADAGPYSPPALANQNDLLADTREGLAPRRPPRVMRPVTLKRTGSVHYVERLSI